MSCLFFVHGRTAVIKTKSVLPSHLKIRLPLPLLNWDFCDFSHAVPPPGSTQLRQTTSLSIAGHAFPCISHLMVEVPYLVEFAYCGRALSVVDSD